MRPWLPEFICWHERTTDNWINVFINAISYFHFHINQFHIHHRFLVDGNSAINQELVLVFKHYASRLHHVNSHIDNNHLQALVGRCMWLSIPQSTVRNKEKITGKYCFVANCVQARQARWDKCDCYRLIPGTTIVVALHSCAFLTRAYLSQIAATYWTKTNATRAYLSARVAQAQ
jgi:hypothetical protein